MWIKYLCDQIGFEEICNKKIMLQSTKMYFMSLVLELIFL